MTSPIEVRALSVHDPMLLPGITRELAHRYFIWDAYVAGERRVEVHPLVLGAGLHDAAVAAAEGVVRALGKVGAWAREAPDEMARYGFHPDVTRLVRASHRAGDNASLMRVDLLLGADGSWRACEVNADCPGGQNEATGLPRLARAAGFHEGQNPTTVLDQLAARLAALVMKPDGGAGAVALLFATAYAEDLQVCALLQRALRQRGVEAVLTPPTAPRLLGGALRVGGSEIRALYRFFPTEYMEGQRNLGHIADAVEGGVVKSISSFGHMPVQSKLCMARAHARLGELDAPDRSAIERYLPYTVDVGELPAEAYLADRAGWVLKRALGRVGDEVFVGPLCDDAEWARLVKDVLELRARGEVWIAQRFVPQRAIPTPWGDRLVTLGAYVLDGQFVGYFARVTEVSHVSHEALVVPVFTDRGIA